MYTLILSKYRFKNKPAHKNELATELNSELLPKQPLIIIYNWELSPKFPRRRDKRISPTSLGAVIFKFFISPKDCYKYCF